MAITSVEYVDFGYTRAFEFWHECVLPPYEKFMATPNRQNAMIASIQAWHLHDWLWHDKYPGIDTRAKPRDYANFKDDLFNGCGDLRLVEEIANASKHRGLSARPKQPIKSKRLISTHTYSGAVGGAPVGMMPVGGGSMTVPVRPMIVLTDGKSRFVDEILANVMAYWGATVT